MDSIKQLSVELKQNQSYAKRNLIKIKVKSTSFIVDSAALHKMMEGSS